MAQQGARAPVLVRVLTGLLLATVPFAAALVAIDVAPPAQVEIAGQQVSVRPVVGQDTSRLFDGALIRPQHADIAGKPVGLDVDADWNKLVPTDKQTRSYLVSLWEDPTPAIHLITDAARRQLLLWGLGGFLAGLLAVGVVVGLWWQRRRRLAGYCSRRVNTLSGVACATSLWSPVRTQFILASRADIPMHASSEATT